MASRDSNNATWYMLRYATDFAPRTAQPGDVAPPQMVPPEAPPLFYDDARHTLELLPVKAVTELAPPPGLAVDVDGEIYLVDPANGCLFVRLCDGSQRPLLCEPGIVSAPAGLALDRRGYLYIADPASSRVIVLRPDDASSVAILHEGLIDPVDVAVAPGGTIYVADRAGGRIVMFNAGFRRKGHFIPQNADGLPAQPKPVAVMIDDDGSILVADASHPRLLRFSVGGGPGGGAGGASGVAPLADAQLSSLAAPLQAAGISLSTPLQLLAGPAGRFVAGVCRPPFPADDGGVLLARIHRYLRLLSLHLSHSFPATGVVLTAALDSRMPGTTWHKIIVGVDLPAGTSITVETATADSPDALVSTITTGPGVGSDLPWASPQQMSRPISFTQQVPDQLVQSAPGRYLRMRITFASDGSATPSLKWLKVIYPRVSYLDYLPKIYQRDPDAQLFLQHFLALFESVFTRIEDRYEEFSRWLNPRAAPPEMIVWLGLLLDLTFDPSWPLARRRLLVGSAMDLYRRRGTIAGLRKYVEIYTGTAPVIIEAFLSRPGQPSFLAGSAVLGSGMLLSPSSATQTPNSALTDAYAHRFTVLVYPGDECLTQTLLPVVDRIITINKPAHTIHTLRAVYPDARVGTQDTIGVDLVVGGATMPHA